MSLKYTVPTLVWYVVQVIDKGSDYRMGVELCTSHVECHELSPIGIGSLILTTKSGARKCYSFRPYSCRRFKLRAATCVHSFHFLYSLCSCYTECMIHSSITSKHSRIAYTSTYRQKFNLILGSFCLHFAALLPDSWLGGLIMCCKYGPPTLS